MAAGGLALQIFDIHSCMFLSVYIHIVIYIYSVYIYNTYNTQYTHGDGSKSMIGTGQPLTHPSFAQVDLREDPQEIMELFSQNRTVKSYVCLVSQTAHV